MQLFGGADHRAEGQKIVEATDIHQGYLPEKNNGTATPTSDGEKGSERRVEDVEEARRESV